MNSIARISFKNIAIYDHSIRSAKLKRSASLISNKSIENERSLLNYKKITLGKQDLNDNYEKNLMKGELKMNSTHSNFYLPIRYSVLRSTKNKKSDIILPMIKCNRIFSKQKSSDQKLFYHTLNESQCNKGVLCNLNQKTAKLKKTCRKNILVEAKTKHDKIPLSQLLKWGLSKKNENSQSKFQRKGNTVKQSNIHSNKSSFFNSFLKVKNNTYPLKFAYYDIPNQIKEKNPLLKHRIEMLDFELFKIGMISKSYKQGIYY